MGNSVTPHSQYSALPAPNATIQFDKRRNYEQTVLLLKEKGVP